MFSLFTGIILHSVRALLHELVGGVVHAAGEKSNG
jgi:hypothetical protein